MREGESTIPPSPDIMRVIAFAKDTDKDGCVLMTMAASAFDLLYAFSLFELSPSNGSDMKIDAWEMCDNHDLHIRRPELKHPWLHFGMGCGWHNASQLHFNCETEKIVR